MRLSARKILLLVLAVGLARAQTESICTPFTTAEFDTQNGVMALQWLFGSNEGGGSTVYSSAAFTGRYTAADFYTNAINGAAPSLYSDTAFINQVPIEGGKNMVYRDGIQEGFIPTANFTCLSKSSAMWGPAYPDYLSYNGAPRARYPNLEVYTHFSAPTETSYIRTIWFIKNTGATAERVRLFIFTRGSKWGGDLSPSDNDQRYYTYFAYLAGDNGRNNDNPAKQSPWPSTLHSRGQKALDQTSTIWSDMDNFNAGMVYTTTLGAGKEFAFMHIRSFGRNVTTALKTAAEIDAEPAYIFHDLTVDQLSMIRNWGGCQAIIGPNVTVTVTPPAQCSSGLTSDFTVQASTSRNDIDGFKHQVVGIQNVVLVPAQSSKTLSVPNDVGPVRHQLWYKECLVKETEFNSCSTAAAPVASAPVAPTTPVAKTPTKTSDASSLAVVSVVSLISAAALF